MRSWHGACQRRPTPASERAPDPPQASNGLPCGDEAKGLLGEPSLVIDRRILCYVPSDPAAGWLFVDCYAEQLRRYDVGRGRYTAVDSELLVRSVRLYGQDFESGLILTPYGKTLRRGPGWWIDHRGQDQSAGQAAIAAQLREIRDADPSQSLRRPGI